MNITTEVVSTPRKTSTTGLYRVNLACGHVKYLTARDRSMFRIGRVVECKQNHFIPKQGVMTRQPL